MARTIPEPGLAPEIDPPRDRLRAFSMIHAVMALLFALASLLLMAIAARTGWVAAAGGIDQGAALDRIEAMEQAKREDRKLD